MNAQPLLHDVSANSSKHTLYVLVRTDIPAAQQMVQAAHAAAETGRANYRSEHGIASLIVLAVPDKDALHRALRQLRGKGIACELFHEPDFGIGDSALATQPLPDAQRKHLRGWPLWIPAFAKPAALQEAA